MTKTHTTITLDHEVLERLRGMNINISGEINDYLTRMIDIQESEEIDIAIEKIKLGKLNKKLTQLHFEQKKCQEKIDKFNKLNEKRKETELLQQKEQKEKEEQCINCGNKILSKFQSFKNGKVCNACYLTADGESLNKWRGL